MRQCHCLTTPSRDELWSALVCTSHDGPVVSEAAKGLSIEGIFPSAICPPPLPKSLQLRSETGHVIADSLGLIYRENKKASNPMTDLNNCTNNAWVNTTFAITRG